MKDPKANLAKAQWYYSSTHKNHEADPKAIHRKAEGFAEANHEKHSVRIAIDPADAV